MSIGSKLKDAREKKKLSIEDVNRKTKIHPSVLKAIEDDKFGQILNSAYIRSFLSKYASFLGLNTKVILQEYNSLHPKDEADRLNIYHPGRAFSLQHFASKHMLKIAGKRTSPKTISAVGKINAQARRASRASSEFQRRLKDERESVVETAIGFTLPIH